MELITPSELTQFLEKAGKKVGPNILSILGKLNKDLSPILNTELGKEILEIDLKRIEELFTKIYQERANELELAEFRYLRDVRIPTIAKKINAYLENIKQIKKVVNAK